MCPPLTPPHTSTSLCGTWCMVPRGKYSRSPASRTTSRMVLPISCFEKFSVKHHNISVTSRMVLPISCFEKFSVKHHNISVTFSMVLPISCLERLSVKHHNISVTFSMVLPMSCLERLSVKLHNACITEHPEWCCLVQAHKLSVKHNATIMSLNILQTLCGQHITVTKCVQTVCYIEQNSNRHKVCGQYLA